MNEELRETKTWLRMHRGVLAPEVYQDIACLIRETAVNPALLETLREKVALYTEEETGRDEAKPMMQGWAEMDFFARQAKWIADREKKLREERTRKALQAAKVALCNGRYIQTLMEPGTPHNPASSPRNPGVGTPGGSTTAASAQYFDHSSTYSAAAQSIARQVLAESNGNNNYNSNGSAETPNSARLPPLSGKPRHAASTNSIGGAALPPTAAPAAHSNRDPSPIRDGQNSNIGMTTPRGARPGFMRSTSYSSLLAARRGMEDAPIPQPLSIPHQPPSSKKKRSNSAPPSPEAPAPHHQSFRTPGGGAAVKKSASSRSIKKSTSGRKLKNKGDKTGARRGGAEAMMANVFVAAGGDSNAVGGDLAGQIEITPEERQFVQNLSLRYAKGKEEIQDIKLHIADALRDPETKVPTKAIDLDTFTNVLFEHFGIEDPMHAERLYSCLPKDRATGNADIRVFLKEIAFIGEALQADERKRAIFDIYDFDGDGLLMEDDVRALFDSLVKSNGPIVPQARAGMLALLSTMFQGIDRFNTKRISFSQFANSYLQNDFLLNFLDPFFDDNSVDVQPESVQRVLLEACHEQELLNQEKATIAARNEEYLKRLGFRFAKSSTDKQGVLVVDRNAGVYGTNVFPRTCDTKGVHFLVGRNPASGAQALLYVKFDRNRFSEVEAASWWNFHGRKFVEPGYFDRLDAVGKNSKPEQNGGGSVSSGSSVASSSNPSSREQSPDDSLDSNNLSDDLQQQHEQHNQLYDDDGENENMGLHHDPRAPHHRVASSSMYAF